MGYSLKSVYGDKAVPTVTTASTGGNYKKMVPPTQVTPEGFEITGFVPGVIVKEWKFDSEKNQLVVTYEDETGATIRDWYTDPEFDTRIINQENESTKEMMVNISLNTIKTIVQKYVYSSSINNAIVALGDDFTFEQYVTTLGDLIMGEKNKVEGDVSLKLILVDSEGTEPKYKVGRNKFIGKTGDTQWGPAFVVKGNQYDDKTTFKYVEKEADFSNAAEDSIDSVFGGGNDVELL